MIGSMYAALAVSVGYLLGGWPTRRIATVLAAAAAGCLGGLGGAAVRRGLMCPGRHERLAKPPPRRAICPAPGRLSRRVPVRQPGTCSAATAQRQAAQAREGRKPAKPWTKTAARRAGPA